MASPRMNLGASIVKSIHFKFDHYLREHRSWLLRWPAEVALRLTVGAGLALVVVGIKDGKALAKAGYILFVVVWVAVLGLTVLAWRSHCKGLDSRRLSLPFCSEDCLIYILRETKLTFS